MIQTVRVLKSEQDLENALSRLGELMDQEFQPGSEEEAEFDLLKLVIDSYESKRFSSPTVTPLQAIEFRMEQQGLSRKDLEQFIQHTRAANYSGKGAPRLVLDPERQPDLVAEDVVDPAAPGRRAGVWTPAQRAVVVVSKAPIVVGSVMRPPRWVRWPAGAPDRRHQRVHRRVLAID